jgi:tripartite ATP-independent transporter DctM subunit
MTSVAMPEMRKYGYKPALSSAAIACGSTLGVVIPPSVVLIVYGIYTEQSIGKLFWGSVIPGLLVMILFCLTVLVVCLIRPELGPGGPRTGIMDKIKSLPGAFEMFFLFALVMFGLYYGWYTPTEAGAAGALFALVLGVARRRLSWWGFVASIKDTLKVSCMIIVIVTGAVIFGRFLTISGMPHKIAEYAASMAISPWMVMVMILLLYAIAGSIMDALGFLLVSIPIFLPVVEAMGYDLLWFGVTLTLVTTMGAITPPVGISAYVVAGMDKQTPLAAVFKGVVWFFPAYLIAIAVLMIFPGAVLWLPAFVR